MRLSILHLSDIHFRSPKDKILERIEQIAGATDPLFHSPDGLIVALTGDIAFGGLADEYAIAATFVKTLTAHLRSRHKSIDIEMVVIPGNHDCDFSSPQDTRDLVVTTIQSDSKHSDKPDYQTTCLQVQGNYRDFHAALTNPATELTGLFFRRVLEFDGTKISIDHVNSAWMSQKKERGGTLAWPPSMHVDACQCDLAVSMLHHPIGWFNPESQRRLRTLLNTTADLVLTGHEHDPDHQKVTTASGGDVSFVRGGVLQDPQFPGSCSFNVIDIDTTTQRYTVFQYDWKSGSFRPLEREPEPRTFRDHSSSRDLRHRITAGFLDYLRDPGASFSHPRKDRLTLDDIFVWPHLRPSTSLSAKKKKLATPLISAARLPELVGDKGRVLIIGVELSGKTSLAKTLFHEFHGSGSVPLLIKGSDLKTFPAKPLQSVIYDACRIQYGTESIDSILALGPSRRVIIVDDLQRAHLSRTDLNTLCSELANGFERCVFLGDHTLKIDELMFSKDRTSELLSFYQLDIQTFGFELREQLIEKWMMLGRSDYNSRQEQDRQITRIRNIVDAVVGRHLIPARPLFIAVILQQLEAATPLSSGAASYAYLFEALITTDLARQMKVAGLDTKYQYLAELALEAFSKERSWLSRQEFISFHDAYCRRYRISIDADDLLDEFVVSRILFEESDRLRFLYQYAFRYFVARALSSDLKANDNAIAKLVEALHRDDYSQVLLFLTYLCRDTAVIEKILKTSRALYSTVKPCDLENDVAFLLNLGNVGKKLKLPKTNPRDNRVNMLRRIDQESSAEATTEAIVDDNELQRDDAAEALDRQQLDEILRINKAIKTVQLLGQILKSRPGTLQGDFKVEVARECYGVGLRALNAVMNLMSSNCDGIVDEFGSLIREKNGTELEAATKQAQEIVFAIGELLSIFFVSIISESVGLEVLGPTLDALKEAWPSAAVSLVDIRVRMEHFEVFPEAMVKNLAESLKKNPFGLWMLRLLAVEHFFLHEEDYRVLQRSCALLDITIPPGRLLS